MTKGKVHKMTYCMSHMRGSVDDPGAFCQWLRQQAAKSTKSKNMRVRNPFIITKHKPTFLVSTLKGDRIWKYRGLEFEAHRFVSGVWSVTASWPLGDMQLEAHAPTEQAALGAAKIGIDLYYKTEAMRSDERDAFYAIYNVISDAISDLERDRGTITRTKLARRMEAWRDSESEWTQKGFRYFDRLPLKKRIAFLDEVLKSYKLQRLSNNPKQKGSKNVTRKTSPRKNLAPPKERWIQSAIKRPGSLGGKGFMSKPYAQQQKLVAAKANRYGYRSALGSVMLLHNINSGAKRAQMAKLKNWLVREYSGEKMRNPAETDDGSWDAIPELFEGQVVENPQKMELTDAQLAQLDKLTNPWPSTYGATYGAYRRHGISKKKARPKARSRVAARSRAGERIKKQRRIMAGFLRS